MAAAFGGQEFEEPPRGATVGLSLSFLAAVRESDVTARARVVRRGSSLNFVAVDVVTADDVVAATAQVIYKLN
jgi:acyl-coenzyme A thioesterase PaaI-like protein